jgi:hypothetical protein
MSSTATKWMPRSSHRMTTRREPDFSPMGEADGRGRWERRKWRLLPKGQIALREQCDAFSSTRPERHERAGRGRQNCKAPGFPGFGRVAAAPANRCGENWVGVEKLGIATAVGYRVPCITRPLPLPRGSDSQHEIACIHGPGHRPCEVVMDDGEIPCVIPASNEAGSPISPEFVGR